MSVCLLIYIHTHTHKVHEHGEKIGGQQVMEVGVKDGGICREYWSGRINAIDIDTHLCNEIIKIPTIRNGLNYQMIRLGLSKSNTTSG